MVATFKSSGTGVGMMGMSFGTTALEASMPTSMSMSMSASAKSKSTSTKLTKQERVELWRDVAKVGAMRPVDGEAIRVGEEQKH
jgi:hypothetical protein